ncbi:MAG: protease inhibitor I42 family protein [Patescibacteria group bacterium]|nr:protease inhibitor I42 family protein [Patescibacteria group bacterium]
MRYLKIVIPVLAVVLTLVFSGALGKIPDALPKWDWGSRNGESDKTRSEYAVSLTGAEPFDREVSVEVGIAFTLDFESNQTTGFRWMAEHDADMLEFVKDEYVVYEPSEEGEPLVGAGGIHHFTYRPTRPGTARIVFTYSRPWESVQPAKRIAYETIATCPAEPGDDGRQTVCETLGPAAIE